MINLAIPTAKKTKKHNLKFQIQSYKILVRLFPEANPLVIAAADSSSPIRTEQMSIGIIYTPKL